MFQLDNVITDKYTGIFATYLTATFYESTPDESPASTADLILPLTTRSNTSSQMLVCPGRASVKTVMPINAAQAWLEVIATGAADEVRSDPSLFVPCSRARLTPRSCRSFGTATSSTGGSTTSPRPGSSAKGLFARCRS